jgi:ADP-heptose:LPS heptosyltransferase
MASRVLLVRLDHTGDCVLTIPSLASALHEAQPDLRIDVLASRISCRLLSGCRGIDRLVSWDAPWSVPPPGLRRTPRRKYLARLAELISVVAPSLARRYDAVLHLSFNPRERVLLPLFGPRRAGFSGPYRGRSVSFSEAFLTYRLPFDESAHLTANCQRLASSAGLRSEVLRPSRLSLPRNAVETARGQLAAHASSGSKWVGIHPGGPTSFKSWPPARFRDVANRLSASGAIHVFVFGSPTELEITREIWGAPGDQSITRVSCSSLFEFACLASHMTQFVANDGGPAHIVAALGVPLVVLFGPTDDRIYRPLGPKVVVLRKREAPHAPCRTPWRVESPCCHDRDCLVGIDPGLVLDAMAERQTALC